MCTRALDGCSWMIEIRVERESWVLIKTQSFCYDCVNDYGLVVDRLDDHVPFGFRVLGFCYKVIRCDVGAFVEVLVLKVIFDVLAIVIEVTKFD